MKKFTVVLNVENILEGLTIAALYTAGMLWLYLHLGWFGVLSTHAVGAMALILDTKTVRSWNYKLTFGGK